MGENILFGAASWVDFEAEALLAKFFFNAIFQPNDVMVFPFDASMRL